MLVELEAEGFSTPQLEFLESTDPSVLLAGGFGSGKSTAAQAKILQLKITNGATPGLVVAQTHGELHTNIINPLLEALSYVYPKDLVPHIKGGSPRDPKIYLYWPQDGGKVYLGSANNPRSYAGVNVGWAVGDEARLWRVEAWTLFQSRVRVRCPMPQKALTSTPGIGWLSEEFNTGRPRRRLIKCPTRLNAANLQDGYELDLRASYSKRMLAVFLEGEFALLTGAVYESLDPNFYNSAHATNHTIERGEKTYLWVDPGFRRSAWAFVQRRHPPGERRPHWVVFDELILDDTSDATAVQLVNDKANTSRFAIDEIWCDPASDSTQGAFALDTIAMMRNIKCRSQRPIRYVTGYMRDIPFGVDKVRALLDHDDIRKPRLFFDRKLEEIEKQKNRGVVKSLMGYSYPDDKGRNMTDLPLHDSTHSHFADAVRYGTVGLWTGELKAEDPRMAGHLGSSQGFKVA